MSSNVTITIGGIPYTIMAGSLTSDDTLDGRTVAQFDVKDLTGTIHFQPGQTVTIVDTVDNYSFTGYVNDSLEKPLPPSTCIISTVTCVDGHYDADKRYYAGPEYQNRYAGDIATDLLSNTLAAEGITAAYAVDNDNSISTWGQGHLSNTSVATNVADGDLELALAGVAVSKTEQSTADWNTAAMLTGLDTTNGQLQLASHSALLFTAYNVGNTGNTYAYQKIWGAANYIFQSGDVLEYKVWVNSSSPQIMAGVDCVCVDGTTLRDQQNAAVDQNGLFAHPDYDLSGFANDQWYYRKIPIPAALIGKQANFFDLGFEGQNKGQYTAYFYDILITNGGSTSLSIYYGAGPHAAIVQPATSQKISASGYSAVAVTPLIAYEQTGTRLSNVTPTLTAAGIYKSSAISWQQTTPATTAIAVSTSIDGAATFQPATTLTPVANFLVGADLTGMTLQTQVVLSITGKDPTLTPIIPVMTWTVFPSYVATKSDSSATYNTAWTGTKTNVSVVNGNLVPTGSLRSWDDASTANQTQFGTNSPFQSTFKQAGSLRTLAYSEARSRFDFAGTWQDNFTVTMDVQVPASGTGSAVPFVGFVYKTTGWQDANDTYGWCLDLSYNSLNLGYGTNTGSGGGSRTTVKTLAMTLNPGDWHTLRVSYAGGTHNVYLDEVNLMTINDGTYQGANGGIGARIYNGSGGTQTVYFDNFGVMPTVAIAPNTPIPQWVSAVINLGSITVGSSIIFWNASVPSGTILNVLASLNGGTYTACTSGSVIPGLSAGTVLTSGTLQLKVQLQASQASAVPTMNGLSVRISSAYSSSGNRVSDVLSLAQVGRVGNTLVSFAAIQPPNTSIAIDTSLDGLTWTQVSTGTSVGGTSVVGTSTIAGIVTQTEPMVDNYASNDSINYTSTCSASGAIASWLWDTANSRLSPTGGSHAHLLYNAPTLSADIDIATVMDASDNGGFVWRWTDQSNYYSLIIHDASNATLPNTIQLFKSVAGSRSQIGANYPVSFTRSMPHTFRVIHIGSVLTVLMDGVSVFTLGENSLTAAGFVGLHTDNTGGSVAHYYLFRQQFYGQDVSTANVYSRIRLSSTDPTLSPQVLSLSVSAHDANIQAGAFISQTSYSVLNNNRMTLASIFDDLIKQSGNFWWRIFGGRFSFQSHQSVPAPWVATGNDTLIANLTVDNINMTYRNSQWITGGTDVVPQTRSFTGNGVQTVFNVDYPIDSVSSATLNGVLLLVGLKGVDTGKQLYYTQGQTALSFDASLVPINSTQTLMVAYNGQVTITTNVQRPQEIARVAALDNTTGIIDEGEDGKGLTKAAVIAKADGLLTTYAQPSKTVTFTTLRSGLAVGQLLSVFSVMGIFDGSFLITDVKRTWQAIVVNGVRTEQVWHDITGISGPQVGEWSRFIANLAN